MSIDPNDFAKQAQQKNPAAYAQAQAMQGAVLQYMAQMASGSMQTKVERCQSAEAAAAFLNSNPTLYVLGIVSEDGAVKVIYRKTQ
jgi:hypothetical protein